MNNLNRRTFLSLGGLLLFPAKLLAGVVCRQKHVEPDETISISLHGAGVFEIERHSDQFIVTFQDPSGFKVELQKRYEQLAGWQNYRTIGPRVTADIQFRFIPDTGWQIDYLRVIT